MKTLSIILIAILALSCKEDDDPKPKVGCQTGILISSSTDDRVLIRCCTYDQHFAGSNEALGGIEAIKLYRVVKWEPCDQCK